MLVSFFRDDHTERITNFLKEKESSKISVSKRMNGIAYGKTGFIFPCSMNLNYLPTLTGEATIAVIVKREKLSSYSANILVNKDLDILYVSSECLKIFNLKEKALWSIKNYISIRKEERLNLKSFVLELNEEGTTLNNYEQEKSYPVNIIDYDTVIKIQRRKSSICKEHWTKSFYSTNFNYVTMYYKEMIMGHKTMDILLFRFDVSFKTNLLFSNEIKFKDKMIFHYDERTLSIRIKNKFKIEKELKKSK